MVLTQITLTTAGQLQCERLILDCMSLTAYQRHLYETDGDHDQDIDVKLIRKLQSLLALTTFSAGGDAPF